MGGDNDSPRDGASGRDAASALAVEQEAHLRLLTDQIPAVVWTTDLDLLFTSGAGAGLKALGLVPEQLTGVGLRDYIRGRPDNDPLISPHLAALRGESVTFEAEWASRSFECYVEPLRDDDGIVIGTVGIALDVTERKQVERERSLLQTQLRHQQKLESIGTLAGGVAHEINNPVQSIMNYAELIKRRGVSLEVDGYAAEILHEAHRVASIVRNLLAFSRQAGEPYAEVRVLDVVTATLSLIAAMFDKEGIRVDVVVPPSITWVHCHPQQLQQVLMNLLSNARDALHEDMPEGMSTRGPQEGRVIAIRGEELRRDGLKWGRVTVEDNGIGIPPDMLDKIFDPFCTTKHHSPGAGLGLSIAHGIVAEHGGMISVESEHGRFTRVHVDLPAR